MVAETELFVALMQNAAREFIAWHALARLTPVAEEYSIVVMPPMMTVATASLVVVLAVF